MDHRSTNQKLQAPLLIGLGIFKHYNDLLKASKHAPIEVALQRKNMIPSSKAFVKAIYNTDSKTGKIYYLEGKGR